METSAIVDAAFRYLDKRVGEEVANMKKYEKKYKTLLFPMDDLCDYLYSNAFGRGVRQRQMSTISWIDCLRNLPT